MSGSTASQSNPPVLAAAGHRSTHAPSNLVKSVSRGLRTEAGKSAIDAVSLKNWCGATRRRKGQRCSVRPQEAGPGREVKFRRGLPAGERWIRTIWYPAEFFLPAPSIPPIHPRNINRLPRQRNVFPSPKFAPFQRHVRHAVCLPQHHIGADYFRASPPRAD